MRGGGVPSVYLSGARRAKKGPVNLWIAQQSWPKTFYFDFVIYFRIFSTIFSLFRKHNYVKIRLDFGIVFVTALHKVILSGHSAAQEIKHL
jgi:hypothetical protein